jgi:mannose/cellobiose epimerase-like protein (N-acyl-D-glucosamine 2-epimerase family)
MTVTTDIEPALRETADSYRSWLIDYAAPLWSGRGRMACGLYAERMGLDGVPDASYFRSFVQARHIFSFVAAGRMGWNGPWETQVGQTVDCLLGRARRGDGFFVHRLDGAGDVLDGRADLYDQAFILFALGTAGGALGRGDLFDAAEDLLDVLEREWARPNGGFTEGEIVDGAILRQNPHMHLLEAFLALAQESGRQRFWDAAMAIAVHAQDRLIDAQTGALREYFDANWQPLGTGHHRDGDIIEPGHCSEWAWLFERLGAKGWSAGVGLSDALVGFARQYGIDAARGVMVDEVWIDGSAKSARARCWPQTERAKAGVARWRRLGGAGEAGEVVAAMRGLRPYLDVAIPGLWRDKMTQDGGWVEELAPGSSLYHISCAIAEIVGAVG